MRGRILLVSLALVVLGGCSVSKAVHQPKAKDLSVLDAGKSRDLVLVELGQPVVSEKDATGNQIDYFKFIQGQNGAAKAGKGILYGALAVTTLGLSEVVTNPVEGTTGPLFERRQQFGRGFGGLNRLKGIRQTSYVVAHRLYRPCRELRVALLL